MGYTPGGQPVVSTPLPIPSESKQQLDLSLVSYRSEVRAYSKPMARGNQRDRDRLKAQAKDAKKNGKNSKEGDPRARAER